MIWIYDNLIIESMLYLSFDEVQTLWQFLIQEFAQQLARKEDLMMSQRIRIVFGTLTAH